MSLKQNLVARTEAFLRSSFAEHETAKADPAAAAYRVEHSIRVANIALAIAREEGFDETAMVLACLLHDISYRDLLSTREDQRNHGRSSARIARTFLQELGLEEAEINDICYAIAIHVDDEADFEWPRTAFSETVSDADNIDRFDVYRIYEGLHYVQFESMTLTQKQERVSSMLSQLEQLKEFPMGTAAARSLWLEKLAYYITFYKKLQQQLNLSESIL